MKRWVVLGILATFTFGLGGMATAGALKIGVHGPMTGPAAEVGRYIKNGSLIAADEINTQGGMLGRQVELVFGDTESKPEVGVSLLERFMTRDQVDMIVGGLHSSVNIAMQEAAAKYGKIFVTSGPVSEVLSDRVQKEPNKYWWFFKTAPSYSEMKPAYRTFFKYLESKAGFKPKTRTIFSIVEDTDYGRGLATGFEEAMGADGWKVSATEVVKIDQADYSAQMSKIRALKPDILYTVQTSPAAAASLCKSFDQSGVPAFFLAIYTPSNPEYIKLTGRASDTLVWASSLDYVPAYAKPFLEKYRERFKEEPGQNAGIQYDAMMNVAAAVKLANSTEPRKIADAMLKIKNKGSNGIYQYDAVTHVAKSGDDLVPIWFVQIVDGKHYKIAPDTLKERQYVPEKWLK
jgi:branched-chain amino acid transport system substrate-binding protein